MLFNQCLVWVARKISMQSDLDLVLVEYYKDQLEFQLKNKETSIDNNNLTELTVSTIQTHLFIFIDWIFLLKFLLIKLYFSLFTPLFSLLFLSFLFIQALSSICYCYNDTYPKIPLSITRPTFLESNLLLTSFFSTNIRKINQKIMAINTPNIEIIPI